MTSQIQVALKNALRTSTILFVFALVGTAMLAFTHDRTEPTITRGQLAEKRALLSQVLPATLYDNDLLASQQSVPADDLLGTRRPSALWLAWRGGVFSGVVLEAVAPDGYSGDIALLIGIDAGGTVTGVRVTTHRETPGLGDYIDRAKSAWIDQFAGKSLTRPEPRHWKVAKDGGAFDARAGATITPRA
ncbi:MAG: electron transport complex subunit RsxG, partial [Thiobacillus sp.]|nr:electron transport complex subunit RsxG [Thiobacillus sp.]